MERKEMLGFFRELGNKAQAILDEKTDGTRKSGKNYFGDFSNRMDIYLENMVKKEIRGTGFRLITEEKPQKGGGDEGAIVLDPLDGSKNYESGFPAFSFSVAWAETKNPRFNDVDVSLVRDLATHTEYSSVKGGGFYIDLQKTKLQNAKRKIPFVAGDFGQSRAAAAWLFPKLAEFSYMRMLGASTIDMALLARGVNDAYVDVRGKLLVTHTAGLALMRDSGAIVTDMYGNEITCEISQDTLYTVIAARDPKLHKKIIGLWANAQKLGLK